LVFYKTGREKDLLSVYRHNTVQFKMGCSQGKMLMGVRAPGGMARSLSEEHLSKIMEYTNGEKEQVEAKYRQFLTKYPKGRISRKSFQTMLSDCFPELSSDRLAQLGSHIWRIYDINEVGKWK